MDAPAVRCVTRMWTFFDKTRSGPLRQGYSTPGPEECSRGTARKPEVPKSAHGSCYRLVLGARLAPCDEISADYYSHANISTGKRA